MTRLRADAILFLAAAIWGAAFVFQKSAMDHIGPLAFVASRGIVAAVALTPLAWIEGRKERPPSWGFWGTALLGGLSFFAGSYLQQEGLRTSTVTNTGFLTALYVVIAPFVAWAWSRKAPARVVWPSVALSIAGVWLLAGATYGSLSRGDMLVALSAVFWATNVIVVSVAARYARPIGFTAAEFVFVSLLGCACALTFETNTVAGMREAAADIAFVGLISGALSFTLFSIALRYTPPSEAVIIGSTETIFAALGGYIFFGERLLPINWLGAGFILAAIGLLQFVSFRMRARRSIQR
jgi:drug/metabolite transporter (DMT)-like permease